MKKALLIAGVIALMSIPISSANIVMAATTEKATAQSQSVQRSSSQFDKQGPRNMRAKVDFDKRLNLTPEQKAKAKAIREKGHEEMKPVMDRIYEKKQQLNAVRNNSKLSLQAKVDQTDLLRKQIGALKRYAHELQMRNMQEFESILTSKQLKTLNKMKQEGRKKFDNEFKKNHPRGPFFGPNGPACGPEGEEQSDKGCFMTPPPPPPEED